MRERTFSHEARVGQVFCGRAVPDGETNQFIGGIFQVPTGEEKHILDMLDEGDGHELLAWLAAKERPPRMTTREGEDMRVCRVVLEVPDPEVARVILDRLYDPHGADQWTEHHELATGESILRATIELEGNRVSVETLSEPRVERVLATLLAEIAGARVVSDVRPRVRPHRSAPWSAAAGDVSGRPRRQEDVREVHRRAGTKLVRRADSRPWRAHTPSGRRRSGGS